MAQEKKGLIARMLEGKEKSEEYARSTLPTNRWQLFWDIFKGNFGKIFKVNLLILIFFIPFIAIIIFHNVALQQYGLIFPFGANLTVGYPAIPDTAGFAEMLALQQDALLYGAFVVASFIAAVGLAGGMYVIRNMVWTEGIFVANDFWRGVKLNYWNALQAAVFFSVVMLICKSLINITEFSLAMQELSKAQRVWFKISEAFSGIVIAVAAMMSLWMIALGVNYKQGIWTLIKNSFLMTIGMLPQSLFFGVLALLPFGIFFLGGSWSLFTMIGAMLLILFAFAYALLVWLDFAQWAFDKFINPKIEGAKVGRGIYNKDGSSALDGNESAAAMEYKRALLAAGKSKLVSRPIKPIDDSLQVYELPSAFTREDLQKLRDSKQNITEDTVAYEEEHKNDLKYVEYNKQFEEREKALQEETDKKGRKKKRKPPKMLGE
ncbi:MAG: hypothetical protein KH054_01900 [Firmicutes bacterium]|jgi:membrane protein|nr:hypothetical protein [Clostridia bacterium]MBS5021889.1 hypothetical protein [Bacillota bacterium]